MLITAECQRNVYGKKVLNRVKENEKKNEDEAIQKANNICKWIEKKQKSEKRAAAAEKRLLAKVVRFAVRF